MNDRVDALIRKEENGKIVMAIAVFLFVISIASFFMV